MRKSKQRRKQRAAELAFWEDALIQALRDVRQQLGLAGDSGVADAVLVNEILRLGDPRAIPGLDAVVPGGDIETAKRWMRARLCGEANTAADRTRLARAIAPPPDYDPQPAMGMNRRILQRAIEYNADKQRAADE